MGDFYQEAYLVPREVFRRFLKSFQLPEISALFDSGPESSMIFTIAGEDPSAGFDG